MENISKLRAVLAILTTTLLWGLSYTSTKVLLDSLLPIQIAFFRMILAALVLGAIFFVTKKSFVHVVDMPRIIAGGAFGIFLYFIFENNGLRFTTAGTGSLIIATIPVINVMAGAIFLHEKASLSRWLGVFLSFVGVFLIIRSGSEGALSLVNLKGNLLIFGAACSWVVYTRINEPLMQKYDSISINLQQSLVGMILLGIFALPAGVDIGVLRGAVLFNLAYLGIFCSAVAYFLYLYALKTLGSATITSFLNLVPVFGVLGGAVILQESLVAGQLLGGVIVIAGVSLVSMTGKPTAKLAPENIVAVAKQ
ncbi:MAG: DMT family transporter [Dethiobacter sp.]|jgi:drug/metabolite transporter (DMT)-like permease|nr:DMT family transporter [Dethiobacter sp.]MBS3988335.1 DMT family transporter [Dethiobacter sp.]